MDRSSGPQKKDGPRFPGESLDFLSPVPLSRDSSLDFFGGMPMALPPLEMDPILRKITQLGWPVREYAYHSPSTVVIFADIHDVELARVTSRRIEQLNQAFRIGLLGVEGWIDDPEAEINTRMIDHVEKVLDVKNPATLEKPGAASGGALARDMYAKLIKSGTYKAVGLEPGDFESVVRGAVVASMRQMICAMWESVLKGPIVIARDEQPISHARNFMKGHEYLKASGINDLPEFPVASFELRGGNGSTRRVLQQSDIPLLSSLERTYNRWLQENTIAERNLCAAEKMRAAMTDSKFKIAAMIYGLDHTLRGRAGQRFPGAPIQEHLADRRLSYIVVDPMPDWQRLLK